MGETIDHFHHFYHWKSHRYRWLFLIFLCGALAGCHTGRHTRVIVRIQSGHGKKIYLSPIPYIKEKGGALDSAIVEDMTRDIVFDLSGDEHLYQLTFAGSGVRFVFINDVPELSIAGNFLTGKYEVRSSPASVGLHRFLDEQAQLVSRTSLKASDSTFTALAARYRAFADTVKSPSAFMAVYNLIEFGKDYDGQARFISAAAARFPSSPAIRLLQEDVREYIKIMKEEFQPGQQLPSITLPDAAGRAFSTASLKGRYYLIDFGSTWCPQCRAYDKAKIGLKKLFPAERFEIVSVAIDAEKKDWESYILREQPNWPQLIDTEMWQGPAVRTLKFDSIPFNFLVDPEGRILQKGIPPDSLAAAIGRALAH